jgi:hypothetical protein
MSWLFSQALVEEYLVDISLDGEPSVPLSGSNTQQAYCAPDKMTKFSRLSRFGMTYKPLTESRGEELLTLYLADFHAKTSAQQGGGGGSRAADHQCGSTWQGSLARLDPDTLLWRTAQCSLLEDLELSLQTFPKWGLMQNGALYPQQTLVQTISVKESGLKPNKKEIWPTPVTRDYKDCGTQESMMRAFQNRDSPGVALIVGATLGGKLNPTFSEWLMGWPLGWTDLKPLETDKSLYVQQQHGNY